MYCNFRAFFEGGLEKSYDPVSGGVILRIL